MRRLAATRAHVRAAGHYGNVSIDTFDGQHLPYIDNLVNLVVAEDLGRVSLPEVERVLAPQGVAYVRRDGRWTKTVKPRPAEIDEWTPNHFVRGACLYGIMPTGLPDVLSSDGRFVYMRPPAEYSFTMIELCSASAASGEKQAQLQLDTPPVFDGMVAARGRLYIAGMDGSVICLGGE